MNNKLFNVIKNAQSLANDAKYEKEKQTKKRIAYSIKKEQISA